MGIIDIITEGLHEADMDFYIYVTGGLQWCYNGVTGALQGYYLNVTGF